MNHIVYPRIHLSIDNCFASKRWTWPLEWGKIIRDLGLRYVEASADNECEPFYNGPEYIADWTQKVKQAEERLGIKVANLYSGHGTYATLGLAHNDPRVRARILNQWLKCMVDTASSLDAGLGFFCHAFDQASLQDPGLYKAKLETLYEDLSHLAEYAARKGVGLIGVEQMYTPHQVPWTLEGAAVLLKQIYRQSSRPFYITIDVGHQCCQEVYQRPSGDKIREYLQICRAGGRVRQMWLGPESAYGIFEKMLSLPRGQENAQVDRLLDHMNQFPYLFAENEDGNPYQWLSMLGCWSPIVHLQQTDGTVSSHKPFNDEYNQFGIIDGSKVLAAIAQAYRNADSDSMPPVCRDIYLTIEVFSGTGDMPSDIINAVRETVAYWRRFVPVDGTSLDGLVDVNQSTLGKKSPVAI